MKLYLQIRLFIYIRALGVFPIAFLLFTFIQCSTSKPYKVNDNKIEIPLTEVTGADEAQLKNARDKIAQGAVLAKKIKENALSADVISPHSSDLLNQLAAKHELSLNEIFAYAVENTERMAIRQEKVIQAEAKLGQAKGSWFPSLSYRYTKFQSIPDHLEHDRKIRERNQMWSLATQNPALWPQNGWPYTSGSSALPPTIAGGSRLVLHVPIVTGLNEYAAVKAGGKLIEQRKFELVHDAGRFYLELANLYFTIIQLERDIKWKEDIIALSGKTVNQLRRYVALGRVKHTDLLLAQTIFAQNEADIQTSRANLNTARSNLTALTGLPAEAFISHDIEIPDPLYAINDAEALIVKRADILAAKLNMDVAKANLISAWGGYMPQVSIDNFYTLPTNRSKDITALLTFQFPILSLANKGQIDGAKSALREAELNYRMIKRQAAQEILQAYNLWDASKKQAEAYKLALDKAEENYKIQVNYFDRRLGTILDLLTSLTNLAATRIDYDHARLQEKLNRIWVGVAVREFPKIKNNSPLLPKSEKKGDL